MSDALVVWLRRTIEGDKAAAGEAAKVYPPPWTLHEKNPGGDERDWDIHDAEDTFIKACSTCEHSGIHQAPGEHIVRHDPRDVVADCDFKLQLLDLHHLSDRSCDHCDTGDPYTTVSTDYPCPTLDLLIARYRHRPGYAEAIKP